jgi:hypothetical protein
MRNVRYGCCHFHFNSLHFHSLPFTAIFFNDYSDSWGLSITRRLIIPSRMWRSVVWYEFTNITKHLLTPPSGRKICHAMNDQDVSIKQSNTCASRTSMLTCSLPHAGRLACFSTLKMNAIHSSGSSVNFYRTTRINIPENSRPCENFKPNIFMILYCIILLYFANDFTISRAARLFF